MVAPRVFAALTVLLSAVPALAQNRLHLPAITLEAGATDATIPILLDSDQNLFGLSLSFSTSSPALVLKEVDLSQGAISNADWSFGQPLLAGSRVTWGIVMDVSDPFDINKVIPAGQGTTIGDLVVDVLESAEGTISVNFQDFAADLNQVPPDPGARNKLLVENGVGIPFTTTSGEITINSGVGPFRRGDCNQDGDSVGTPADAIFLLNFLFSGATAPLCRAACDFNGDGQLEATPTDVLFFLNFSFLGGAPLPEPLRECGVSSRPEDLTIGCDSFDNGACP